MAMIDDLDKERGLEEALRQANRKLNLLGSVTRQDMQDQFMAMNGFISMAHDGCDNEVIKDYLEKALRSGENIKHILEFSRDYDRIGMKPPEWFTLKETVERVLTDLKIEGIRTNIKLDGFEVLADQLFERALYHLMDSVKRQGTRVTEMDIYYDTSSGGLKLVCEDNGPGYGRGGSPSAFGR